MSLIPSGSFTMGRTSGDTDSNAPPVTVTVSAFYMQENETTKAQWDEVRTWGSSNGYTDLPTGGGKASNHPVHTVRWSDVVKWCNARSEMEALTPIYTVGGSVMRTGTTEPEANFGANGYRLPTEAEWEKAARGGVAGKRFPWGTDTISHDQANYNGSSSYAYDLSPINNYHPSYALGDFPYTSPVGSFAPNGYGLHDMSGNVMEWCWDWYGASGYANGVADPRGAVSGVYRVRRGGDWEDHAFRCRAADRFYHSPDYRDRGLGLRPARNQVDESATTIESAETENLTLDTRPVPTVTTSTDFGRVTVGRVGTQTFTLSNPRLSAVTLTGNPLVEILGEHASDFEVSVPPATEIPAGGSVTFEIRFAPTQPGERQAMVQLAYESPGNGPINFAIQGFGALSSLLAQTISFSAPASVYVSQSQLALTGIASSGLQVSFTLISGPALLQGSLLTLTGPGTVKVEARQLGGGNYASAKPVQRTITVKANPTTLTLANLFQIYDGTPRPITVLGADDASVSYRHPDGLYKSQAPTAAGSYLVSAFAAGSLRKGTLVITRAPIIVQAKDQSKHLGEPNPELEVTFSGFVGGDTQVSVLVRPISVTTKAKDSSPPGVYPITSSGGSAANYTLIHRPGKLVVEGFVGSFEALLRDPNTTLPAGLLKLTVPAASRSASAKLALGVEPVAMSLAGPLALDAETRVASGQFSRTVRSIDTYDLNLTISVFGELSAEVRRNGVLIATATDGIRLRDKIKGATVPQAGAYTGEMELGQSAGPNDPFAPGWTTAKVDAGGTMAMTGRLGDGTVFTASLPADLRGGYRFFGQPYKPVRAGAHISGTWSLEPHPNTPGRWKLDGAQLTWVKAARDLDTSYRAGFGPLTSALSMSPWQPPSKTVTLTQLLGVEQLTVEYAPTGSSSETSLPNLVALTTSNTLQVLAPVTTPPNIRRWTAKVIPVTGAFTGSFQLLDLTQLRTVKFSGVMRQSKDAKPGELDSSFNGSGFANVAFGAGNAFGRALAIQSDAKILLGGYAHNGSNFDFAVTRFMEDGTPDIAFGEGGEVITSLSGGDDYGLSMAIQNDGKILLAGYSEHSGIREMAIVRYLSNGLIDGSFGSEGKQLVQVGQSRSSAWSMTISQDDKILLAGWADEGGRDVFASIRLKANGTLDPTFGVSGKAITAVGSVSSSGRGIAIQEDGKIVVGGFATIGSSVDFAVVRYESSGILDTTFADEGIALIPFGNSSTDYAYTTLIQADSKIIVAGSSSQNGTSDFAMARLDKTGILDQEFGIEGKVLADFQGDNDFALKATAQLDGKLILVGSARVQGSGNIAVARFNTDGTPDLAFGNAGKVVTPVSSTSNASWDVSVTPNGRILVAGWSQISDHYQMTLVRYVGTVHQGVGHYSLPALRGAASRESRTGDIRFMRRPE